MSACRSAGTTTAVVAAWPGLPPLDGRRHRRRLRGRARAPRAWPRSTRWSTRGLSVVGVDAGRVAGGRGRAQRRVPARRRRRCSCTTRWPRWGAVAPSSSTARRWPSSTGSRPLLGPDVVRRGRLDPAGRAAGRARATTAEAADREPRLADCAAQADALRAHGIAVEDYDGPLGRGHVPARRRRDEPGRAGDSAWPPRLERRAPLHEHTPVTAIERRPGGHRARRPSRAGVVDRRRRRAARALCRALAGRVRTARLQMLATAPVRAAAALPGVRALGLRLRPAGRRRAAVRRRRARPVRRRRVDRTTPTPTRAGAGLHRARWPRGWPAGRSR